MRQLTNFCRQNGLEVLKTQGAGHKTDLQLHQRSRTKVVPVNFCDQNRVGMLKPWARARKTDFLVIEVAPQINVENVWSKKSTF